MSAIVYHKQRRSGHTPPGRWVYIVTEKNDIHAYPTIIGAAFDMRFNYNAGYKNSAGDQPNGIADSTHGRVYIVYPPYAGDPLDEDRYDDPHPKVS